MEADPAVIVIVADEDPPSVQFVILGANVYVIVCVPIEAEDKSTTPVAELTVTVDELNTPPVAKLVVKIGNGFVVAFIQVEL
jgi:hypothetical protein